MIFSSKQKIAMTWWRRGGQYAQYDAIFCDGAVRSGKTLSMGLGFFLWSMSEFKGAKFGLCGKTITSLRRNVLSELLPQLCALGFSVSERRTEGRLTVRRGGRENEYYCFGGKDEGSAALIQGITLGGVLLDEAALMPRSFVEQACARCSLSGSRLWFNCNPAGPGHWLYQEWVLGAQARNCLHLHFTMEDNPGLSQKVRERYERLYTGVFYERYVRGLWVAAEGRVYDFFKEDMVQRVPEGSFSAWYISCDYGTVNPASFGLWGCRKGIWYRVSEFYFDSRREKRQMTDAEYAAALRRLADTRRIEAVIVDPSAASFIELLRREGWNVLRADNDVLTGIRRTADALKSGEIVICESCTDARREIMEYVWDEGRTQDAVCKRNDHAMDDMRYFVQTVLRKNTAFAVKAVARRR